MNEKLEQKRKRGRPVTHPRVVNLELNESYSTFTEAGNAIEGSRYGVRKCCEGTQRHHHGYHFVFAGRSGEGTGGASGEET